MSLKKVQIVVIAKNPMPCVLLLKVNDTRGAFWQNITGGVDAGENSYRAAMRELYEETAIKNASLTPLHFDITFCDHFNNKICEETFLAIISTNDSTIKISDEHQEYKWKNILEVTKEDYGHLSNYEVLKKALEVFNA